MFYPRIKSEIREPDPRDEEFYQDKLYILEHVRDVLLREIEQLRLESEELHGRDPVDHCKSRIKSALSVEEKLSRRGLPVTLAAALESIHDAVGIRVVCPFLDDIYLVRNWLAGRQGLRLVEEKDYIANPKANGYRSLHLIMAVPVPMIRGHQECWAEIQIRTLAMDFWAALEHQLKYKQQIGDEETIVAELKRCAYETSSTDINLLALRELITAGKEGPLLAGRRPQQPEITQQSKHSPKKRRHYRHAKQAAL